MRTTDEKLVHALMRFSRKLRMSAPDRGPEHEGERRPMGDRRPPLAREHILFLIARHEGGIHQKDLIEMMHVNPSTMSEFVNKLEDGGYIVRTVDPEDKRATLLTLSEKGEARIAELKEERGERFRDLFKDLSEEEKEQLLALLTKALGNEEEHRCHRHHHRCERKEESE